MRRKRFRKKLILVALAMIISTTYYIWEKNVDIMPALSKTTIVPPTSINIPEQEIYSVERVVDGDTFIVNISGESKRVRLIGVDTPESVHPDAQKNVDYGEISSQFTKNLIEGKSVILEFDIQKEDRYGRILAYVYLPETLEMLNELLLSEGHAVIMTVQPNSKYVERFVELERIARENAKGIWEM